MSSELGLKSGSHCRICRQFSLLGDWICHAKYEIAFEVNHLELFTSQLFNHVCQVIVVLVLNWYQLLLGAVELERKYYHLWETRVKSWKELKTKEAVREFVYVENIAGTLSPLERSYFTSSGQQCVVYIYHACSKSKIRVVFEVLVFLKYRFCVNLADFHCITSPYQS